jgi:hypothetical protein
LKKSENPGLNEIEPGSLFIQPVEGRQVKQLFSEGLSIGLGANSN